VFELALKWLDTPEAAKAARREVHQLRLPLSEEDLLQETRTRLWRTTKLDAESLANLPGYARRAMQNTARDLHRKRRRRVVEDQLPDDEVLAVVLRGPDDIDVPSDLEDECRRAAHGALAAKPWAGAAVLNELTFRLHPDVPIPRDAPGNTENTSDAQACRWAALWLAGKWDCFPDKGQVEDAAMRKRRSRALDMVFDGLAHAVRVSVAGAGAG
jgi:hypothetical protein